MDPTEKSTEENSPLKQIRTYQGDVASAINKQNETLVSIQRAQAQKNAQGFSSGKLKSPEEMLEEKSKKTAILLLVGMVFLIGLGATGAWYAYKGYKAKTALPTQLITPNKFLITESSTNLDALALNKDSFIQAVQSEWIKEDTSGIKQLQLERGAPENQKLLTTEDFLSLIQSHAPANLIRSFDPLFMFGFIGGKPKHTFLLIKLDSFDNAFPGMIEWEKYLADDTLPLFNSYDVSKSIASQTSFSDITIKNKDARILKSPSGQTVLLYSFYNNNMLILTDNEETLRALLTRLDSEKLSR